MKKMTRIFTFLLAMVLLLSLIGCGEDPVETTQQTQETTQATEPKELTEEEKIIAERRDIAESYMRKCVSILWRSEEDITYQLSSTKGQLRIFAGRLYQGLPYAFSGGTVESFLENAGEPDEKGVYTISGLQSDELSGAGDYTKARVGTCCSSTVMLAWSQISDSFTARSSFQFYQKYGVYPVGDYVLEVEGDEMRQTGEIIIENTREKIYECYAQLQKGDAIVRVLGQKDHSAMVVDVVVVYNEDGTINPAKSRIIKLEQTNSSQKSQSEKPETIDPNEVFAIGGVDTACTFKIAAQSGYIPVTIKELQDASYTPAEPTITDTETEFNKDTILAGTISCNWMYDAITLTITDEAGAEVQKITARTDRYSMKDFVMERFLTDVPATLDGSLDLEILTSGNYHCTVVCRLTNGQEVTARDFDFTV